MGPSLFFEGVDRPGQGKDVVVRPAFYSRPVPLDTGLLQQAVIDGGNLYGNIDLPCRHIETLHQGLDSRLDLVRSADNEGIRITMQRTSLPVPLPGRPPSKRPGRHGAATMYEKS